MKMAEIIPSPFEGGEKSKTIPDDLRTSKL
jgi:hypothetical protein